MTDDLTDLRARLAAAADKATQGEWAAYIDRPSKTCQVRIGDDCKKAVVHWVGFDSSAFPKQAQSNAAYIALASPVNVKRLIARVVELEAALTHTLDGFESFMREADWGKSGLSADTIRKANEAPIIARTTLKGSPNV